MIRLQYAPKFLKQLRKLEPELQKEVFVKVELFKNKKHHIMLEVYKLKGRLSGSCAFSVNYRYRIVFDHVSKEEVVLLAVGDHDVYKK